ncbi:MAG: hypothetical protein JSV19_05760 [Phycisphaerales bacterium]|nr:MAG: hypothetical protein JSV19_05760 [Phycisphaerales bacterium]
MPTYEYQCTQCGRTFELFQQITEKPRRTVGAELRNCRCDAPVARLIGAGAGILFKGEGFYETDYRSESYKKAAKAEKEARSNASSEAGKSDTPKKPDTGKTSDAGAGKGGGGTSAS